MRAVIEEAEREHLVSTRQGLRKPQPASAAQLEQSQQKAKGRRYRCVYCKRTLSDPKDLGMHEARCDARFIMKRMWALKIAAAHRKDRREGRE